MDLAGLESREGQDYWYLMYHMQLNREEGGIGSGGVMKEEREREKLGMLIVI